MNIPLSLHITLGTLVLAEYKFEEAHKASALMLIQFALLHLPKGAVYFLTAKLFFFLYLSLALEHLWHGHSHVYL